jgi:hypothetical protein
MSMRAQTRHVVRSRSVNEKRPPVAAVRNVDVVCVHRYADARVGRLVREANAHGALVVCDDEDDAGSSPEDTAAYRRYGGFGWRCGVRRQCHPSVTACSR